MSAPEDSQINCMLRKEKKVRFFKASRTRPVVPVTSCVVWTGRGYSFALRASRFLSQTKLTNCFAELVQEEYHSYLICLPCLSFSSSFCPSLKSLFASWTLSSSQGPSSLLLKQRKKNQVFREFRKLVIERNLFERFNFYEYILLC